MTDSWRIAGPWHGLRIPPRQPVIAGRAVSRLASRLASRLRAWCAVWWQRAVRSRILPAEIRAQLTLSRGERILTVGYHPDGGYALIATDRALHYRDHRAGTDGWSRLGWELITRVGWDSAGGRLAISGLAGIAPPRTVVPLRDHGTLLELAEERISYTRLGSWPVMLDGHRRVHAEARRRPVTGELLWVIGSRDGIDLGNGHVRRQVDQAVTRLRDDLGITRPSSAGRGLL